MLMYQLQAERYIDHLEHDFENLGDTVKAKEIDSIRKKLFETNIEKLLPVLNGLVAVTTGKSEEIAKQAFEKLKQTQIGVYQLYAKKDSTNEMLQKIILDAVPFIKEKLKKLKDNTEYEPWVENKELQRFPKEILQAIAKRFHTNRNICIFENDMERGESLLAFKENMKTNHEVVAYGKDLNIEYCNEARESGVDFVAKIDVQSITHHCFDLSMNFLNDYTFFQEEYERTHQLKEEKKLNMLFDRSIPADDGYVLLNLPYFKIPELDKRLTYFITIDDIYRIDDPIKNVLIVARKRKNKGQNEPKLRRAMLMYQSLPSIEDMKDYYINKGEFNPPKVFKAYFVDEEDVMQEFKNVPTPIDVLDTIYTPTEKIIELSNPLQEVKQGHYAAIATSGLINGIYDTSLLKPILGKDLSFTHLFCTKVVQQDKIEIKTVMHDGREVEEISEQKMNFIVSNLWTPDGEFIELLDTQKENNDVKGSN